MRSAGYFNKRQTVQRLHPDANISSRLIGLGVTVNVWGHSSLFRIRKRSSIDKGEELLHILS